MDKTKQDRQHNTEHGTNSRIKARTGAPAKITPAPHATPVVNCSSQFMD